MPRRCLLLLLALTWPWAALAAEKLRLTNGEWLPYQSQRLQEFGFASEVVTRAFALEGIQVEYQFLPWKRAYDTARDGHADGTLVWRRSPERELLFYFSEPVFEGQTVFFHRRDQALQWRTLDDLHGQRLGLTLGYQYLPLERPELADRLQVERVSSDELNFRKLLWQRIDVFPSDLEVGYATLREHFNTDQQAQITHHPQPLEEVSYHLLLNRKNGKHAALIERFNRGLAQLKQSGEYQALADKLRGGGYAPAPAP